MWMSVCLRCDGGGALVVVRRSGFGIVFLRCVAGLWLPRAPCDPHELMN